MIFTRTKRTAQKVADELAERGFKVGAVHGDLGQGAREKALKSFRTGEVDVLVATDVAARGIDIDDITHVINFQIPEDEQAYVHRIGRTGRAGKTGIAVTLVDWDELPRWSMIDKALSLDTPDPAETYSNSPHFYEEMKIPAEAGGTIGKPKRTADKPKREAGETRESSSERTGDRPTRNRYRSRTRGGQAAGSHPEATTEPSAPEDSDGAGTDGSEGARPGRRRRRRRPSKAAATGTN
jgi:superfamily II DNA/RNA helicase